MKRLSFVLFTALFACTALRAEMVELPEWHAQADSLLNAMDGIADEFDAYMQEYAMMIDALDAMNQQFDDSQQGRRGFFDAVAQWFASASSQISDSQVDLQQLEEQKNLIIAELEAQLVALHDQTAQEIEALNATIEQLNNELNAARAAYATLVDLNEDRAEELIDTLTELKDKYSQMVDQRSIFLTSLERVMETADNHFENEAVEVEEFVASYPEIFPVEDGAQEDDYYAEDDYYEEQSVTEEPATEESVSEENADEPAYYEYEDALPENPLMEEPAVEEQPEDDYYADEPIEEPAADESAVDAPIEEPVAN